MRRTTILRGTTSALAVAAVSALLVGHVPPAAAADETSRNLVLQTAAPAARKEQRLALVIGNSAYREAPLSNPVNDARAMAQALQTAGFTVLLHTDVDHRELLGAVRDFGNRLRQGGVGVFYYAGHGMQIKGRNYLIPIGADIQREDEVAYAGLDAQAVLDKMEAAANGTNLMILDACRNNPFARSFRSSVQGLAQMEAPVGTLVAFATAPGSVASDGQGSNGLYTQHLLTAMRTPGAKVEDVFKQVRAGVRRDSQGKQVPWESTSLEGDLYFVDPVVAAPAPKIDTAKAGEEAFWAVVKDSHDAAELRAYLGRYPQGQFAALARARLAALAPPPTPAVPVATAPTVAAPVVAAQPLIVPIVKPPPVAAVAAPVMALTAPAVAVVTPAAPALHPPQSAPAESRRSNAVGNTVGDTWNYQAVDKLNGGVVRNYTVQVDAIKPDGGWISSSGGEYDEHGRAIKWLTASGDRRQAAPYATRWWHDMKVGETKRFKYDLSGPPAGDSHWVVAVGGGWINRIEGEARVVGIETVKVPAGEFRAYRFEHKGTTTAVGRTGFGSFTKSYWYVPELHTAVAYEEEATWNGRPNLRAREELTSFHLAGSSAPGQAAIAVAAPVATVSAPPATVAVRPSNAHGYAVGDKWSFQRVDKWKGEVVENLVQRVDRLGGDGTAVLTGDAGYREPWYRFLRSMLEPAQIGQSALPGRTVWWEDMKPGDSRPVEFKADKRLNDGSVVPADVKVKVVHKGTERIRVPAGEFEAIRLDCEGSVALTPSVLRWEMTLWYVPALHSYAAADLVSYKVNYGYDKLGGDRERLELTSFEVHGSTLASR